MGGGISKHQEEMATKRTAVPPVLEQEAKPEQASEESKCPMHKSDGSYTYDWTKLFSAAKVHGPGGKKTLSKEHQERAKQGAVCPVKHESAPSSELTSGCPVKHDNSAPQESGCPVKGGSASHQEYNVYSQPIDSSNKMPKGVKTQLPTSTQQKELSTSRVSSTIPKGGASKSTWTYPSPQQFYNALVRKGKLGETSEEDVESVVALHNNMNEKTWAQVVEWERQTYSDESTPKLLKFQGRPTDLSPKAMLKHYLWGHPLPFDRHDWTILRDDGMTIRYVIDYYYDETRAQDTSESAFPALHDRGATPSLLIDVRPALDGPEQLFARAVQMPYKYSQSKTTFDYLPLKGTLEMASQVQESIDVWQMIQDSSYKANPTPMDEMKVSADQAKKIAESFAKVLKQCAKKQKQMDVCGSEEECMKSSMDLTSCMGPILCPVQHSSLVSTLQGDDEDRIEAALSTLSECVVLRNTQWQLAKEQHPSVFQ
jgi:cytochrome c heme-lyase